MATVTVFGAVRTVTGSMHLVETGDTHFLLDCGLFQGRRADAFEINSHFPFPVSSINAVVPMPTWITAATSPRWCSRDFAAPSTARRRRATSRR